MAFEKGNTLASKSRKVERLIERALVQEDDRRLRMGIEALLDKASEGERWALEFVRDSIDGKPKQSVEMSSDPDNPPHIALVATAETLRQAIRGENAKD